MKDLNLPLKHFFVLIISICLIISCKSTTKELISIEGKNIEVMPEMGVVSEIEEFVAPYRKHIQQEMAVVLTHNPTTLVKDGDQTNTAIGNLFADASFDIVNPIFSKKTGKNIDFVLLNWGGIRSDLLAGDVTLGTAYNLMPFENKLVILEIKGNKLEELTEYLIRAKKPHPLSRHVELQITDNDKVRKFTINNQPVNPEKTYMVATSDFLMNGGDGMLFFQNPIQVYETDYLIRNILIDYFKKIDIVQAKQDNRFILVKD